MKIKSITSALIAGCLTVASMLFFTGCGETQSKTGLPKAEETTEAPAEKTTEAPLCARYEE